MANTTNRSNARKATPTKTGVAKPASATKTNQTVTQDPPITVDANTPPPEGRAAALQAAVAADAENQARPTGANPGANDDLAPKITEGVGGDVGTREEDPTRYQAPPAETQTSDEAADAALAAAAAAETPPVVTTPAPPAPVEPEPAVIPGAQAAGSGAPVTDTAATGRDLAALAALADTRPGVQPVTPYPADGYPAPAAAAAPVLPLVRNEENWLADNDEGLTCRVLVDGLRAIVNKTYRQAYRGDRITAPADLVRAAAARGAVVIEEN